MEIQLKNQLLKNRSATKSKEGGTSFLAFLKPLVFTFLCSCFNFSLVIAQVDNSVNLIKNPSFEENLGCPDYSYRTHKDDFLDKLLYWQNASEDIQHAPFYLNYSGFCELNKYHYQFQNSPRNGEACVRSSCYFKDYSESLEVVYQLKDFLRGELSSPLVKGRKYYLSFYTVLDETNIEGGSINYGINSLGCYIHKDPFYFSTKKIPGVPDSLTYRTCHQFKPQVRCSPKRFIIDTTNYSEIAGVFTANGEERFITVGNFTPNAITQYKEIPKSGFWASPHSYYVFDDFTLIPYPDLGADTCMSENDTITLSVPDYINLPDYRFLWSTKVLGKSIQVTKSGIYWVEYTAGYTTVRDSIKIVKKGDKLKLKLLKPNIAACNDSLELGINSNNYNKFKWSTGDTSATIMVKEEGLYKVNFQNQNGCTFTAQTKVQFPKPYVEAIDSEYCAMESSSQALKIKHGNFDYIIWQSARDGRDLSIGDSVELRPGSKWDSVLVNAYKDGCVYTDIVYNRIFPWGIVQFPKDEMICEPSYKLKINYGENNVGANTKILWSTGSTDSVIYINRTDTYWVKTETVNGCRYKGSIYLGYDPFVITDKLICRGDSVSIDISNLPFGKGYEFPSTSWFFDNKRIDSLNLFKTATFTKKGTYRLLSVLRNPEHEPPYSCIITDTFTIAFDTIKKILPNDTTICNASDYVLKLKEVFDSVSWTRGNLNVNQILIKKPFGTYEVEVYRNGCKANDTVRITADSLMYKVLGKTEVCEGKQAEITLITDNSFEWKSGVNTSKALLDKGVHQFFIYNKQCGVYDSVFISYLQFDSLISPFTKDTYCLENAPVFFSNNSNEWLTLNEDSIGASLRLEYAGNFYLGIRNKCYEEIRNIIVIDHCKLLSIPNAISPNGDGVNDVFKIVGLNFQQFSCSIFGRNGQLLHTSSNPDSIWNGTIGNNVSMPIGDYLFVAEVVTTSGKIDVISGFITIIK